jgi:hypothetical protein
MRKRAATATLSTTKLVVDFTTITSPATQTADRTVAGTFGNTIVNNVTTKAIKPLFSGNGFC